MRQAEQTQIGKVSQGLFRSFPLHPHPSRPVASVDSASAVTGLPLARQASPFPSRLARLTCRIEFTFVQDRPSVCGCCPLRLAATPLPRRLHSRCLHMAMTFTV